MKLLKELLKEMWEDFKNPPSARFENKTCCSSYPIYLEDNLRPELLRVIQQDNKNINPKNNQS